MENLQKIEWNESYSVGIEAIDRQHKRLVEIINNLNELIAKGEKAYEANYSSVFEELLKYTEYHFSYEEDEFIDKFQYHSADIHKATHRSFVRGLNDKLAQSNVATLEVGKQLYKNLSTWLLNHIAKADKAWSKHVHDERNKDKLVI